MMRSASKAMCKDAEMAPHQPSRLRGAEAGRRGTMGRRPSGGLPSPAVENVGIRRRVSMLSTPSLHVRLCRIAWTAAAVNEPMVKQNVTFAPLWHGLGFAHIKICGRH